MRNTSTVAHSLRRAPGRHLSKIALLEHLEPRVLLSVSLPPVAPIAVTVTAKSPTSVEVDWNPTFTNAWGFDVLRSTDGVTYTKIGKVASSIAKSYTDFTVSSGNQYYYEVDAYN